MLEKFFCIAASNFAHRHRKLSSTGGGGGGLNVAMDHRPGGWVLGEGRSSPFGNFLM